MTNHSLINAERFTRPMRSEHVASVVTELERHEPGLLKIMPMFKLFLGGSFVRCAWVQHLLRDGADYIQSLNDRPSDIDIWSSSADLDEIQDFFCRCPSEKKDNSINYRTSNRIDSLPINLVLRWTYNDADSLIEDTDFSICQCIVWYDRVKGEFTGAVGPKFYNDIEHCRTRYSFRPMVPSPYSTYRMMRLFAKGYKPQPIDVVGVMSGLIASTSINGVSDNLTNEVRFKIMKSLMGLGRTAGDAKILDGKQMPYRTGEADEDSNDRIYGNS